MGQCHRKQTYIHPVKLNPGKAEEDTVLCIDGSNICHWQVRSTRHVAMLCFLCKLLADQCLPVNTGNGRPVYDYHTRPSAKDGCNSWDPIKPRERRGKNRKKAHFQKYTKCTILGVYFVRIYMPLVRKYTATFSNFNHSVLFLRVLSKFRSISFRFVERPYTVTNGLRIWFQKGYTAPHILRGIRWCHSGGTCVPVPP